MSDHGANPIFFNNRIKIGHPEHSLTSHPPSSDNITSTTSPYTLQILYSKKLNRLLPNLKMESVETLHVLELMNFLNMLMRD